MIWDLLKEIVRNQRDVRRFLGTTLGKVTNLLSDLASRQIRLVYEITPDDAQFDSTYYTLKDDGLYFTWAGQYYQSLWPFDEDLRHAGAVVKVGTKYYVLVTGAAHEITSNLSKGVTESIFYSPEYPLEGPVQSGTTQVRYHWGIQGGPVSVIWDSQEVEAIYWWGKPTPLDPETGMLSIPGGSSVQGLSEVLGATYPLGNGQSLVAKTDSTFQEDTSLMHVEMAVNAGTPSINVLSYYEAHGKVIGFGEDDSYVYVYLVTPEGRLLTLLWDKNQEKVVETRTISVNLLFDRDCQAKPTSGVFFGGKHLFLMYDKANFVPAAWARYYLNYDGYLLVVDENFRPEAAISFSKLRDELSLPQNHIAIPAQIVANNDELWLVWKVINELESLQHSVLFTKFRLWAEPPAVTHTISLLGVYKVDNIDAANGLSITVSGEPPVEIGYSKIIEVKPRQWVDEVKVLPIRFYVEP